MTHERRLRHGRSGEACHDECPHAEATVLWSEAISTFGTRAAELRFLRSRAAGVESGTAVMPFARRCGRYNASMTARARKDEAPGRTNLHLAELLDFRPDQGIIRLHEQRVVILSAAAMGLMRKELVDTFGVEHARRLLLRFGFADGYHDAVNLRAQSGWDDPLEGLRAGAMLHTLEGIVRADVVRIDHDAATGRFEEEVTWHDSYEAEQHLHHYGPSADPVCWSLVGYSSGFVSACLGKEIYFRETTCAGQGTSHCTAIGRDAESWGVDIEPIRTDFQAANLGARSRAAARSRRHPPEGARPSRAAARTTRA